MQEKDFEYKDLPKNRKESIIRLIKYQKSLLLKLVLIMIPFSLPLFIWLIYSKYFFNIVSDSNIFLYVLVKDFPFFFFMFLYTSGLSGVYYVLRRALFGVTINFNYHFFKGIKDSGFEFGFNSLFYVLFLVLIDLLLEATSSKPFFILVYILSIVLIILMTMIIQKIYSSSSLYIVSLTNAFKDGITFTFKHFKNNLYVFFLSSFSLLFLLPSTGYVSLGINCFGILLYILFGSIFSVLCTSALSYEQFDIAINKIEYPQYYKAGLYVGEEDAEA